MDITANNASIARGQSAGFLAQIATYWRRSAKYRQTYNELNALSDRELSDIGVARSLIAEIAAEAASDVK